jgi:phage shock protein A
VSAPVKKAAEQHVEAGLATLGLPSRTQVIGLSKQIAALEDKIENVEDRIDAVLARLHSMAAASKKERE